MSATIVLLVLGLEPVLAALAGDGFLGMAFDHETGEELLKSLVSVDYGLHSELQDLSDELGTTIVLMAEDSQRRGPKQQRPLVLYQTGETEEDLPVCRDRTEVCSKVDMYGEPWVERQCRCASGRPCSSSLHADDGHTIVDKTRQYKLCEPVKRLPICRYFKDTTWTIEPNAGPRNETIQKVNCRCRPGSVAYLLKRQSVLSTGDGDKKYIYSFACSPQSRMKCQPKEPCRLFTVHKKSQQSKLEEVNASPLCQCQRGFRCPRRHTDPGTLPSKYYGDSLGVKIYSGHCVPVRHSKEPVYALV